MRVSIPKFSQKSELFAYLRSNHDKIIKQKKSLPIKSDVMEWGCLPIAKKSQVKADGTELGPDEILVDAIANLSGWCDSYRDVMIKDNWNKTISDKSITYALKNHDYSTDAIIGKDPEFYTKNFNLDYFGIKSDIKSAQALMQKFICVKEYDPKTFYLYRDGQIKQQSIGLRYIQILLCLDSNLEEDVQYKKNWDKYYKHVINKDMVDEYGYFFAVIESQILENSCVLFGANINTGTFATGKAADDAPDENEDIPDDDEDIETEADDKSLQESNKRKFIICN